MKGNMRYGILGVSVFILGIFIFFLVKMGWNNAIHQRNKIKHHARELYNDAEYKGAYHELYLLIDSLDEKENTIQLNLAHAGFLISRTDSTALQNLIKEVQGTEVTDSVRPKNIQYEMCLNYYQNLADTAREFKISSIALNQLGILTYKYRDTQEPEVESDALDKAALYFKSAIEKDGNNEIARYNFELIRRKIDYPEKIMAKVKTLVAQRQYRSARNLIQEGLEKDNLMKKKYSDFSERIETVIKIDSLSRS